MPEIIRKYADLLYPTPGKRPPPLSLAVKRGVENGEYDVENAKLPELINGNPLLQVIADALSEARVNAAMRNLGEYKGGESGKVIKQFLKDIPGEIPAGIRNAMIRMASENVAIPVAGNRELTFAPSEYGRGMDTTLSNVLGGDLTLGLDPSFLGLRFQKQF